MTRFKLLFCGFLLGVSALAGCQKVNDFFGSLNPVHQQSAAPAAAPTAPVAGPTTELEKMGAVSMAPAAPVESAPPEVVPQKVHKHGMSKAEKAAYGVAWANAAIANQLLGEHCYKTNAHDKAPGTYKAPECRCGGC